MSNELEKPELPACPFCGTNEPELYPTTRRRDWYVIVCANPACEVEMSGPTVAKVIEKWSRRAYTQPVEN